MSNRLHTARGVAGVDAHLLVSWPEGADIADIEEAIKDTARAAVRDAREHIRGEA